MEDRQRVYTIVAVIAVVAIVLSCLVGAAAGAVAGLLVGQDQGRTAAERVVRERAFQALPQAVPLPQGRGLMQQPEGAIVLDVTAGTPADQAGLRRGDVIVAVDRTPIDAVHNLGDVLGQYQPGDRVTLSVWRAGQETMVPVVLGTHPSQRGRPYLGIRYQMSTGLDLGQPDQ